MYLENFAFSGRNCFLIYTGKQYIFWYAGGGVFAVADRETAPGAAAEDPEIFTLYVGNNYAPAGDNAVIKKTKSIISRLENEHVSKKIIFDVKTAKLHNYGVNISTYENK